MNGHYFRNKNVIVAGTDCWCSPLLSKHRLTLELTKENKVIYVEPFFHFGTLLKNPKMLYSFLKHPSGYLLKPQWREYHNEYPKNLIRIRGLKFPKSGKFTFLRKLSEWLLVFQLKRQKLIPEVVIAFSPYFAFLKNQVEVFIYYPVDSMSVEGEHPDVFYGEEETLRKADIVSAGTYKLYNELMGKVNALKFLPHGVDVDALTRFSEQEPVALKNIPKPIIGFLGAINSRLDLALIESIARERPMWSIVLVGPTNKDAFGGDLNESQLENLKILSNVYFVGACASSEVGAYFRAFNVSIMPYDLKHPFVHFASHKPLQCLAVGTPVVTTCHAPEDVLPINTIVANSTSDFIEQIEKVLKSHTPAKAQTYREAALSFTWKKRIDELSEIVTEYLVNKNYGRGDSNI